MRHSHVNDQCEQWEYQLCICVTPQKVNICTQIRHQIEQDACFQIHFHVSAVVCFSASITPEPQHVHTECMNNSYELYRSVTPEDADIYKA